MAEEKLNLGAVADKPGSSRANKTGSWRTFKPRITDRCIGCGICVQYCPEACIEIKGSKGTKTGKRAVVDYDFCKGCMICMGECPHKAIEQEMDKK
jgi:2-oxoacid:acceptor oxidoreductase delta subunit (pyruvate/2-ketoisovalerate family)